MEKFVLYLMFILILSGLNSAALTTVKRDSSDLTLAANEPLASTDLDTAESGKLLDLGGLLNRNPYNNNYQGYSGYSGYNPYGSNVGYGNYNPYGGGRFGYGSGSYAGSGGYYPNTGGYGSYGGYGGGYNSGFTPSNYYGGYSGSQYPIAGQGGGYGYGGYGTTNILGGQYGNGGYGGNSGNSGLKSYLGYDSDYSGHRNLGAGYYPDSDRYGFRNSYVPTSPALHVSGYRGYD